MSRDRYSRSNTASPEKSPGRNLPQNHIIENRYSSYHRAEDYIKHLTKIYDTNLTNARNHDEAYFNTAKFRTQTPSGESKFKVSTFPKAKVNKELLEQQELLNAFNNISSESKSRCSSRQKSRDSRFHERSSTARYSFSYNKVRLLFNDKCRECKRLTCCCPKVIQDEFIKNFLRKHTKSVEKAGFEKETRNNVTSFTVSQRMSYKTEAIDLKKKEKKRTLRNCKDSILDSCLIVSLVPMHDKKKI